MRKTLRMWRRFLAYALASACCIGCSSSHHDHDETASLGDVVFVGGTTDEALSVMLDSTAKDVASERVTFVSPAPAAELSKDAPVTVEFQTARAERLRPPARLPFVPSPPQRALWDLKQLLAPIRVAHAHGTPFNGTGYFLVFADASGMARLRVFTAQTAYTPDEAAWRGLAIGRQPIALRITSATFEENAVLVDGGPFAAGSIEFSVR